jgi:hypothetical protein
MTCATPTEAGEFLTCPTNQLIGVIADAPQAKATIEAVHAAGFVEDQVDIARGSRRHCRGGS